MLTKAIGFLKAVGYKIKYGDSLCTSGRISLAPSSQINIKSGKMLVGKGFSAKPRAYFAVVNGGKLTIGDRVSVNRNCMFICHDTISIGDHCSIGPNTLIYDHDHRFDNHGLQPGYKTSPVVIENNCWIGANVVILRGTHIGEGSVIGAGAIVKGVIPPHSRVTSKVELNIVSIEQESWN